jgi:hypothetical protein
MKPGEQQHQFCLSFPHAGSVTETALSDGRRVTVALQISGVYAPVGTAPVEALTDPTVIGYLLLGITYFNPLYIPETSGLSKVSSVKSAKLPATFSYE